MLPTTNLFIIKEKKKPPKEYKLQQKKWKILNRDATKSIVDVVLTNRNLPADHMDPFRLSERMHSPYLLPDMEKGVRRILQAIENEEKILVFGDYDVDGITSTALMVFFFRKINYPVEFMLPHREKDGYGLRISAVEEIAKNNVKLIITVDNGISSHEAIELATEKGIDVVVTDHHLQEGTLPPAAAVINPNRSDSEYPFKTICGAAVAFKVIYALAEKVMPEADYKDFLMNHLDLVAIGTISDVMPLRDENYALVKFGLKVLSGTKKPGLIELKKISGVKEKEVSPVSVGFFLGPRLNASGRLESAEIALKLLITPSMDEARDLAQYLDGLNRKRQGLQNDYLTQALNKVEDQKEAIDKVIFVENEDWQAGLIGLVSGRLKELYARPAFAFTVDSEGNYVGSARSIDAFHVTNALTRFKEYFITYGGHHKAAGLTVAPEKYEEFKEKFTSFGNETLKEEDLIPILEIDSVVDIDQINMGNTRMISEVGPFGETNPEPVFVLNGSKIRDIMLLSGGKHLKLVIEKGNQSFECVWWNAGSYKDQIRFGDIVSTAFKLSINNWRGSERLQLVVEDMKYSEN